uniref:Uncharacterized protein n=1 Tax=Timema bartmani TaxID=61472 RepID=A0A7R9HX24_9NEOP|nr:unnamed protein product [Timema bartmani]
MHHGSTNSVWIAALLKKILEDFGITADDGEIEICPPRKCRKTQELGLEKKSAVNCQSAPKKPWGYCSFDVILHHPQAKKRKMEKGSLPAFQHTWTAGVLSYNRSIPFVSEFGPPMHPVLCLLLQLPDLSSFLKVIQLNDSTPANTISQDGGPPKRDSYTSHRESWGQRDTFAQSGTVPPKAVTLETRSRDMVAADLLDVISEGATRLLLGYSVVILLFPHDPPQRRDKDVYTVRGGLGQRNTRNEIAPKILVVVADLLGKSREPPGHCVLLPVRVIRLKEVNPHLRGGRVENHLGNPPPPVHPTEIRTSISPSSVVWLNTTGALANYATKAGPVIITYTRQQPDFAIKARHVTTFQFCPCYSDGGRWSNYIHQRLLTKERDHFFTATTSLFYTLRHVLQPVRAIPLCTN